MALVTHKFKLDLTPGAARQVLYTSQGDIGRPFEADLYWNGSPWTATGTTASIRGKKPDDTVFDYAATVSGTAVTFETTEQMTIISGPVECELVFSNDGDIIASANFVLIVEGSPYNPDNLSESDVEGLTDLLAGFQRLNRDSNGVVKIGDNVTASGEENPLTGFYVHDERYTTDGVSKLDFNSVDGLQKAFENYDNGFLSIRPFSTWTQGSLTNGNVIQNIAYRLASVTPIKFDKDVTIHIESGRRAAFHFLDDDGNFVSDQGWKTTAFTIPANTPFRVLISATPTTSAAEAELTATVDEWTGFLTLKTNLSEYTQELATKKVLFTDLVVGDIVGGVDGTDTRYVRPNSYYPAKKGNVIVLKSKPYIYRITFYYYSSNNPGSYLTASEMVQVAADSPNVLYTIEQDGFLRFKANSIPDASSLQNSLSDFEQSIVYIEYPITESTYKYIEEKTRWLPLNSSVKAKAAEYLNNFTDAEKTQAFLFFTDQHLMGTGGAFDSEVFNNYINVLFDYVESVPLDFILNGGDWLNNGDTAAQAKEKLGYVAGVLNKSPIEVYSMIGNHDYNYLGDAELSSQEIANILERKNGNNYYSFDTAAARYYVFDTYTDDVPANNAYKWEQLNWLAQSLINDDKPNNSIFLHIYWLNSDTLFPFSWWLGRICYAYNNGGVATLDVGGSYDFSNCNGHVDFVLAGHSHMDFNTYLNDNSTASYTHDIPVIGTTHFRDGNKPTFDLFFVDYDERKIKTVRVGTGNNREFTF